MFCQYCGKELPSDARFCPECGSPVAGRSAEQPQSVSEAPNVAPYQQQGEQNAPTPPASYGQQTAQQSYGQQPAGGGGNGQGNKRSTSPVLIVVIVIAVIALVFVVVTALGVLSPNKSGSSSASQSTAQTTSQTSSASSASTASSSVSSTETSSSASSSAASTSSSAARSASSKTSASSSAASSSSSSVDPKQSEINKAIAQGYQIFEGTLYVLSNSELAKMQNIDPSLFAEGTVAVLVFDEPTQVSGMSSDGSGMRTKSASMMGVAEYTDYGSFVIDKGNLDSWKTYDGEHVTIGAMGDQIWFPSDVSLPVGEPRTEYAVVLG